MIWYDGFGKGVHWTAEESIASLIALVALFDKMRIEDEEVRDWLRAVLRSQTKGTDKQLTPLDRWRYVLLPLSRIDDNQKNSFQKVPDMEVTKGVKHVEML